MRVIEIFKDIAKKIPRCSGNTTAMLEYLREFATAHNCIISTDDCKNLHAKKGNPKICLQAHYDMVCLGDGSPVDVLEINSQLKAANSTLGADNGIGIAMMLALMETNSDIECLFTNDEEIGLIGARGLDVKIESEYILNLDAEEEGFVYIGCAGGFELKATKNLEQFDLETSQIMTHSVENLPGGHSGIDINKNIPNAIIENLKFIKEHNGKIITFEGGEKLNSIPKSANCTYIKDDCTLSNNTVDFLLSLPNGVLEFDYDLGIPRLSINLAKLHIKDSTLSVQMYARAMTEESMKNLEEELVGKLQKNGFSVSCSGHYAPWKPETNEFSQFVRNCMKKHFFSSGFKAIHAGLECGVLKEKMPQKLFASIGPNIHSPHTLEESVEIDSVIKTFVALEDIMRMS